MFGAIAYRCALRLRPKEKGEDMEDRIRQLEERLTNAIERIESLEDQVAKSMVGMHGLDRRTRGLIKIGGPLNRGPSTTKAPAR